MQYVHRYCSRLHSLHSAPLSQLCQKLSSNTDNDLCNRCASLATFVAGSPTKVPVDPQDKLILQALLQLDQHGTPLPQAIISDSVLTSTIGRHNGHQVVAHRRRRFEALQFIMKRYTLCYIFNTIASLANQHNSRNERRIIFPKLDETPMKCLVVPSEGQGPRILLDKSTTDIMHAATTPTIKFQATQLANIVAMTSHIHQFHELHTTQSRYLTVATSIPAAAAPTNRCTG